MGDRRVSIIVPVYGDWESLNQNIRALKKYADSRHEVLLVNDCGPEADDIEARILKSIKRRSNFTYHRNKSNLGFVKNCNNAVFALADKSNDILLLNSDAVATRGFLDEMLAVLYAKDTIGAVCPRSNAATIFSIPMRPEPGKQYSMRESYRMYKKIKKTLPQYYDSPIAHGFCMLIRRSVIDEHGLFDEIYDKGYGEENDFCMRIGREGLGCAVANRAYVYHYKARSFTEEKRTEYVKKNEKILDERYSEYRESIKRYLESITTE